MDLFILGEKMKKIILIVEDEIPILELLQTVFEFEKYEVLSAKNGNEGLRMSRDLHPDIVILDKRLPDMDGVEVCASLKSDDQTSNQKILMLSGYSQDHDLKSAQEAKVDAYMTKPFVIKKLIDKVEELLV